MPGASLCTPQALPLPVCCTHFNLTARVSHCNKATILLRLSLFLFAWEHLCLPTPLSCTPILRTHLFLPITRSKRKNLLGLYTNTPHPPKIPVYNIMTNIFKTPGKKHVFTHSKLNKQFYFSQVLGFIFHFLSSCLIICPF